MPNKGATENPGSSAASPATVSETEPDSLSISDERLLARVRAGDGPAGQAIVARYAQPLMRYLQRLVGEAAAEELHQQTWLSVLSNIEKFDPAGASSASATPGVSNGFKSWVYRIATNKANDYWRSRGRERTLREGLRLVTETEAPWAGERTEQAELAARLRQAIERLPENQRQIIALRYYSNMKFVDIASMLGCPLNTALGRVHKAMIRLRQMLEEGAAMAGASPEADGPGK